MERQEDSKIVEIIKWVKENRKPFFTTLLTVIIIVLIIAFICFRTQMVNSAASDKLNIATKVIGSGNIEQGLSIIDDLIKTYKDSPAAY
ncbi:MAG: hypothetical protein IKN42_08200, partial [Elusimicrobia bacterium]|nr:hypothetical protein [Elusimicrobiota bacterium]